MSFGIFKKIKEAVKKAAQWTRDKVIRPVIKAGEKLIKSGDVKKLIDTGIKLAPMIGGAVGASKGNPQIGLAAGSTIQNIGNSLGFGLK